MRFAPPLAFRNASPEDRPLLSPLDWRDPLDLLALPPNLLAYQGEQLVAHLAAPPDPQGAAWIRSFCVDATLTPLHAWRTLWAEAAAQCTALGATHVASLISGEWMRSLLVEAGFPEANSV